MDVNRGDTVVFTVTGEVRAGRIVKSYDDNYIKIRYLALGFIPIYRIDRIGRMLAHKPRRK